VDLCLKYPQVLATRIVQEANGSQASRTKIKNCMEWMLCTWDPAHRLELVAKDIRLDRLGVEVQFISVPLYAQTPKDISAMYA
jgi:hypothetical protein